MKVKLKTDLTHIFGGEKFKKNDIVETIEKPEKYKDISNYGLWINGKVKNKIWPIRILPFEYEIIEK